MIEVEYISPYTIVKKNDLYGIVDRTGNLVVPCVMDEIVNDKDEEVGLETWADFFCVIIVKDGKYGFFTNNGKLIEPAYEFYAIDPCGGDIHVKTDKGYGMFASTDYLFEEIPVQYSLLEELDLDNFDDDLDESFFETGEVYDISLQSWQELGVNENIVTLIKEKFHTFGYEFARNMWNAAYNENDNVDLRTFVDDVFLRLNDYEMIEEKLVDIKGQIDCDEIKTWEEVEKKDDEANILRWCVNMAFRGAVSFITLKGVASANIPLLNRKIRELLKREENGGYYSTFRLIDGLLPRPEHSSFDVIPVKIPAGNRPSCRYHFLYKEIEGEIGEIYLYEHGMHAYYVSVNVYDVDNPEELLDENHILDISDITLSELLTSLQQAIDPARENAELSAAIEKATNLETEKSALAQILTDCGIYALSMSDFGRTPHYCDGHISGGVDYMVVEGNDVVLVLNSSTPKIDNVVLNEQCGNYSWIVEEIKAAANTAYKRATL